MMSNIDYKEWSKQFRMHYEGYAFFTSVFTTLANEPINKYHISWNGVLYRFRDALIDNIGPDKPFRNTGDMIIDELLNGNDGFYREMIRVQGLLDEAINRCLDARETNNYSNLKYWWEPTRRALDEVCIIFNFDRGFDKFILKLKDSDPQNYKSISSNIGAAKPSFFNESDEYLITLANKYDDFDQIYAKYIQKFGWVQNSYKGPNCISKEWLKEHAKVAKESHSISADKIHLDAKYKLLVDTASFSINFRDDKKKLLLIAVELMDAWLNNVCKENNLNKDAMLYLTLDEILGKDKGELAKLSNKYYQAKARYGFARPYGYEDVDELFYDKMDELNINSIDVDIINGIPASKGKICGIVKVITDARLEQDKFCDGDILVSSMTRPEFLPLMQKAAAFVTDEGGISCHAAIVAREMGKPCVIATKFATKVLHDGDMVEVDAIKGIVRKIN